MSYPGLSLDSAKSIDESRRRGGSPPHAKAAMTWKAGADFKESTARDCLNQVCDLVDDAKNYNQSHAKFDSLCAPLVHRTLNIPPRIAGDADFWRWLTFTEDCYGAEIVDWRYGSDANVARSVYYGLGLMKKGMFSKLWICANMMFIEDAPNPYDGIEYPDVDL